MTHKLLIRISFVLLLIVSFKSKAQPYHTGLGVRFSGITSGISVRHFTNDNTALEGIIGFGHRSFFITGLYEKFQAFPTAEGLSWFYGGGAHIGLYNDNYGDYYYYKRNKYIVTEHYDSRVSFGGDFIIGLDYKFKDAPINLSLDVKPYVDLVPGFYGYWEGALSIRFTL